jgi:GTP-binding protein
MSAGKVTDEELAAAQAAADLTFARGWHFVMGTPSLEFLPPADRAEVAFAGRSNVGKSSLINAIVGVQGLARTSNTPGRTQELNFFFGEGSAFYLVDMPGYGFAKAPKEKVDAWTGVVKDYLRGRSTLKRVMLLIDARHGVKPPDREIFKLLNEAAVAFQLVLTKGDKLNAHELAAVLDQTREAAAKEPAAFPEVLATSSAKGKGLDEIRLAIWSAAHGK